MSLLFLGLMLNSRLSESHDWNRYSHYSFYRYINDRRQLPARKQPSSAFTTRISHLHDISKENGRQSQWRKGKRRVESREV